MTDRHEGVREVMNDMASCITSDSFSTQALILIAYELRELNKNIKALSKRVGSDII